MRFFINFYFLNDNLKKLKNTKINFFFNEFLWLKTVFYEKLLNKSWFNDYKNVLYFFVSHLYTLKPDNL